VELPEATKGDYRILKQSGATQLVLNYMGYPITIMSDSEWEVKTHSDFVQKARGDVLIAGLGIGYSVVSVKDKPEVQTIVVVEKEQDVIDLVWPHVLNDKSMVVCDRVLHFMQNTEMRFDIVWFDILKGEPDQYPAAVQTLTDAASRILKDGGEILFWRGAPKMEL
jgi:spermidine synthase